MEIILVKLLSQDDSKGRGISRQGILVRGDERLKEQKKTDAH